MRRRQLNPRQRQGLLLLFVAALGLIGVFALIVNYVSSVSHQVGPKIYVLRLVRPISAYQQVAPDDLGEISVPRKWAPSTALTDPSQALQLISDVPLRSGTVLEQGMLIQPSSLAPGDRKIAITVNQQTGVAGQVQPGDSVDVIATYQGSSGARNYANVVVPHVEVLGVGETTSGSGSQASSGLPVTLSLTPAQVLRVNYAESFAQTMSLSIVAPGTSTHQRTPAPYAPTGPR
jgi:pilus assembly protein CpaB